MEEEDIGEEKSQKCVRKIKLKKPMNKKTEKEEVRERERKNHWRFYIEARGG